jgi:pyrroline-5-carboxylate reductase
MASALLRQAVGVAAYPQRRWAAVGMRWLSSVQTPRSSTAPVNVVFIGGGKMAEAFISGLQKTPSSFHVTAAVEINKGRRDFLRSHYKVPVFESAAEAGSALFSADLLVLAVKPQVADAVMEDLSGVIKLGPRLEHTMTTVSILAGVPMERIRRGLETESVCRAMPNTPAQAQAGMTVWTVTPAVSIARRKTLEKLFEAIGVGEYVSDENVLDAATALSGSGPAYFLLLLESMVDAAVHIGLSRELANKLALQTMYGTAVHTQESPGKHHAELRNDITSPGGTTAFALYQLERGGFRTTVSEALWESFKRSRELGQKDVRVGPLSQR